MEKKLGLEKNKMESLGKMLWKYMRLDLGRRYLREIRVIDIIKEKMKVQIQIGIWMKFM